MAVETIGGRPSDVSPIKELREKVYNLVAPKLEGIPDTELPPEAMIEIPSSALTSADRVRYLFSQVLTPEKRHVVMAYIDSYWLFRTARELGYVTSFKNLFNRLGLSHSGNNSEWAEEVLTIVQPPIIVGKAPYHLSQNRTIANFARFIATEDITRACDALGSRRNLIITQPKPIKSSADILVDPKVIAKAKMGDHTAFESIYIHYWDPIYNFVYRMLGNPEDAFDFTQDTFMKAYCALPRTSHDLRIRPWIYRIATNACIGEIRHRKLIKWQSLYAQSDNLSDPNLFMNFIPSRSNNEPLPIVSSDRAYNPEAAFLAKENYEEIQAILDRLYPKYRACLILLHYQDLSYDEIAKVLNTTRAAVKSLLSRAREEFRQVYARSERKPNLQPSWSWVYD